MSPGSLSSFLVGGHSSQKQTALRSYLPAHQLAMCMGKLEREDPCRGSHKLFRAVGESHPILTSEVTGRKCQLIPLMRTP